MSTPFNEALRLLGRGAQRAFQWYMRNPAGRHMINYGVSNLAREYKNARLFDALRSDANADAAVATLDQNLTDKARSSLEKVIKNAQRNAGVSPDVRSSWEPAVEDVARSISDEQLYVIERVSEMAAAEPAVSALLEDVDAAVDDDEKTALMSQWAAGPRRQILLILVFFFYLSAMLAIDVTTPGWQDKVGDWEQHLEIAVLAVEGIMLAIIWRQKKS